jgi:hypothetical protein
MDWLPGVFLAAPSSPSLDRLIPSSPRNNLLNLDGHQQIKEHDRACTYTELITHSEHNIDTPKSKEEEEKQIGVNAYMHSDPLRTETQGDEAPGIGKMEVQWQWRICTSILRMQWLGSAVSVVGLGGASERGGARYL